MERFLKRLDIIDDNTHIIPLDWPNYEEWMYSSFKKRVMGGQVRNQETVLSVAETKDD